MKGATTLPDLSPKEEPPVDTITLPSLSFGFMVFKDADAPACVDD